MRVLGAVGDPDRVRGRQHGGTVGDLEVRGGDREPAVMGDADLDLGAATVAQQAGAGRAVGTGQDLDAAPWEADPRAVEALDHRLFGRPPAGQALVVAAAVVELGLGVDLLQEAGAGAPDREGDAVDRDGVDADSLHGLIVARGDMGLRRLRRHLPTGARRNPPGIPT